MSSSLGHARPPPESALRTVRVLVCRPSPHALSHGENADQGETSQSTGHGAVLQVSSSRRGGHEAPPPCLGTITVRARLRDPEPHALSHAVQSDHGDTSQSTAQRWTLHIRASVKAGHGT